METRKSNLLYTIKDGKVWSYKTNSFVKPYSKEYLQSALCKGTKQKKKNNSTSS